MQQVSKKCKQIWIFSVFKIASISPYWLQIKFSMSLFFYLCTFAINNILWIVAPEFRHSSVNNQRGIQRWKQDFDKKSLYLKRYTAKRLTDEFPEKGWTKHGVNMLLKKLRDTGTVESTELTEPKKRSHNRLFSEPPKIHRKITSLRMLNILNILIAHKYT